MAQLGFGSSVRIITVASPVFSLKDVFLPATTSRYESKTKRSSRELAPSRYTASKVSMMALNVSAKKSFGYLGMVLPETSAKPMPSQVNNISST